MFGYSTTGSDLLTIFTFLTGFYYNFDNLYAGFKASPSKSRAIACLVPYFQVYILVYASGFSRFYGHAPLLFFAGLGLFQTYVAGLLNISSTAKVAFPWLHWEPIVYALIIFVDATRIIKDDKVVIALYGGLTLIVFVKYTLFLRSMITQLTSYLGIKLLKVKDKTTKRQ